MRCGFYVYAEMRKMDSLSILRVANRNIRANKGRRIYHPNRERKENIVWKGEGRERVNS